MKFLVFAASHRKESINRKLARYAADFAQHAGAEINFVEYGMFDMPIYDDETYRNQLMPEPATRFVAALQAADGMIIAAPEYNWSLPGSLKNIIDWASVATPHPFTGKTALLLSASPSLRGGMQGLIQLKMPLDHLCMHVFPKLFPLSLADKAFDVHHVLADTKIASDLKELITDFMAFTGRLAKQ